MVKLGNVAIDGTKIMANASTRRSVPYEKLTQREKHWKETMEQLLAKAQRTDQQEDQRWGQGQPANPLPPELAQAQSRLERIRQAKAQLEREAQEHLESAQQAFLPRKRGRPSKQEAATQSPADPQQRNNAGNQMQRAKSNAEQPARQYNFVDPDSRVMKDNGRKCFTQAYNAQIAVDANAQVIVAAEVTQETTDRNQLLPMVRAVRKTAAGTPETVVADAGYWDSGNLQNPSLEGIRMLVSPDSRPTPPDAPLPPHSPRTDAAIGMRQLLASETGKALYAQRKATVEPVFGQIKEACNIRR